MNKWDEYIRQINSAIERTDYLYEKYAKRQGVNSYVSHIMYMIYISGIKKQKDIAENYGMPKQTVNTVISELRKKGYISLTADENDKRSKLINLTDEGIKYAETITSPLLECEKAVLEEMGKEEVEQMIRTMEQYAGLLEKAMNASQADKKHLHGGKK